MRDRTGGIFVNYRRSAPPGLVDEIDRRLRDYFGEEQVFLDRKSIRLGHTWSDEIRTRLADSDVLLVLVHEEWLTERDESGTVLLRRERDWVREEIELALASDVKVIPILLDGAQWPADADLPESIRPIRGNQAHRVCAESLPEDVDDLITRLRADVAPTWTPADGGAAEPWRPGRWLAYLTGLLSLVALAGPAILVRDDSPAAPGDWPPLVSNAFDFVFVMLAIPIVFGFMYGPVGRFIGLGEREVHRAPAADYYRMAPLLIFAFLVFIALTAWQSGVTGGGWVFVVVAMLIALLVATAFMLRTVRKDRELDNNWPHTLGRRLRAPAVRRAMDRLDERLTAWRWRLSREQEDKAAWMLDQFAQATRDLTDEAARRRWRWLLRDHRWGVSIYAFWVSSTTGFLVASVVPEVRGGTAGLALFLLLGTLFALMSLAVALTVEVTYRQHCRWRQQLVDEIEGRLATFRQRLADLTAPAPWETRGE